MERNNRQMTKKKTRHRFLPPPLKVIREYPQCVVVSDTFQRIRTLHKQNVKPLPERDDKMFKALPEVAQAAAIGFPFSLEELDTAMEAGEGNHILARAGDKQAPPERPDTRAYSRQPQAERLESDSEEDEGEENKKVTFDLTEDEDED